MLFVVVATDVWTTVCGKASSNRVIMITLTDLTEECTFLRLNFCYLCDSAASPSERSPVFFTFHHHFIAFVVCHGIRKKKQQQPATTLLIVSLYTFYGFRWKHLCEREKGKENFIGKVTLKIPNGENNWHTHCYCCRWCCCCCFCSAVFSSTLQIKWNRFYGLKREKMFEPRMQFEM